MEVPKLILLDRLEVLPQEWTSACQELLGDGWTDSISIVCKGFREITSGPEKISFDCVVSPANSFGLMDGGFDLVLSRAFGGVDKVVPHVQAALQQDWLGQQNVGTCAIIDMGNMGPCRYIAHSPTMRLPITLPSDSDIVYRCMWSILNAVRVHNRDVEAGRKPHDQPIHSVLCTGLGTGVGRFPLDECARQMVLAVKHFKQAVAAAQERQALAAAQERQAAAAITAQGQQAAAGIAAAPATETAAYPGPYDVLWPWTKATQCEEEIKGEKIKSEMTGHQPQEGGGKQPTASRYRCTVS